MIDDPKERLRDRARAIYAETGDCDDSVTTLIQAIRRNNWLDIAVDMAARQLIADQRCRLRSNLSTNPVPKRFPREMQDRIQASFAGLFAWPLMDGTPLGNATREQVTRDGLRFRRNATGNLRSATFLDLVADRMGEAVKVSDALTELELSKLMEEARKKASRAIR